MGEGREGRRYTKTDGGIGEERNEGKKKKKKKLRWGRDRRKEGRKMLNRKTTLTITATCVYY